MQVTLPWLGQQFETISDQPVFVPGEPRGSLGTTPGERGSAGSTGHMQHSQADGDSAEAPVGGTTGSHRHLLSAEHRCILIR